MKVAFSPRGRPDLTLEGELADNDGPALVVSHPHPLAGGTMHHPVSAALFHAAAKAGYRALRYNFRGVENSTGRIEDHSPLAIADLAGALDFFRQPGPVLAIGYSYGARCTLHAIHEQLPIRRAALVALPTRLPANRAAMSNLLLGRPIRSEQYKKTPDLELVGHPEKPVKVFAGGLDPLVQPDELIGRGVEPWILEGVNHFFARRLGNQPAKPADLARLAEAVLGFLG